MFERIPSQLPLLVMMLASCWPATGTEAAAKAPRAVIKQLVDVISSYEPSVSLSSKHNRDVSRLAHRLLGVEDLARRSLDGQWGKLGKAQRATFVSLLKRLLEQVAYPKSAKFFKGLELTVDSQEVKGARAKVKAHVLHDDEGEVAIDFELRRSHGRWLVWDIYLDGVSLASNVRTQVQRVIADESFDGLIKRMKEKLEGS